LHGKAPGRHVKKAFPAFHVLLALEFHRSMGKQLMRTVTFGFECELRHHVASDEVHADACTAVTSATTHFPFV